MSIAALVDEFDPRDEAVLTRLLPHPTAAEGVAWLATFTCPACSTPARTMSHKVSLPRNLLARGDARLVVSGLRPACSRTGERTIWVSDPSGMLPTDAADPGAESELI